MAHPLPATSARVLYNAEPLRLGVELPPPSPEDLPRTCFKLAALERVRAETSDYVRAVLDAAALRGEHRFVVVDVKVQEVEAGRFPCIPGWHCDSVLDPHHPSRPEVHHLFVSGAACLTEFVAEPVELEVGPAASPRAFLRALARQVARLDPAVRAVPSCRLVEYGRLDLHRGARAREDERRLLVRVTETDVIEPRRAAPRPAPSPRRETAWTT
ncbi:MAG: hypothetical protein AB7N76_13730 [Planctomycetota bacterium]